MSMNGQSLNILEDNIERLKQVFPELFADNELDWEKLKTTFTEATVSNQERYTLGWAGKADAFKCLQQQTTATLSPARDESINFDTTENIFIEGENLEVLKVLQKAYYGKIKCIIIDPPYNTGNDSFIYPDNFKESKESYKKRIGDTGEEGYLLKESLFRKNSKDSGHFHSNWLSMMYPRLFLAKNLLAPEGVIFVHIDDNEVHNLRLLMNEIFGEENFVAQIIWEKAFAPVNLKKHFSESHDYIICFARRLDLLESNGLQRKDDDERYKNPDDDPRGVWTSSDMTVGPVISEKVYEITTPGGKKVFPTNGRCWLFTQERFREMVEDNRIWFGEAGNGIPRVKKFLTEVKAGITPMTIWKHTEVGHSQDAAKKLKSLFDGKDYFDYPKSVQLIKKIIQLYCLDGDIIFDFFAGSGTTAQAILELNREAYRDLKFILVQLGEPTDNKSEAFKSGYKTIAAISKERIRRVIKKGNKESSETEQQNQSKIKFEKKADHLPAGFKVFKLCPSNFKTWQAAAVTEENLESQLALFVNPVKDDFNAESMLYELMLKSGYPLTTPYTQTGNYYSVDEGRLVIALSTIDADTIAEIIRAAPKKVIILDALFTDRDELKTNTALQMHAAGIDFKTV